MDPVFHSQLWVLINLLIPHLPHHLLLLFLLFSLDMHPHGHSIFRQFFVPIGFQFAVSRITYLSLFLHSMRSNKNAQYVLLRAPI